MPVTHARGDTGKQDVLGRYALRPIVHTRLLEGQSITCCCGDRVAGEYYQFEATDRTTQAIESLFAGAHCAARFHALDASLEQLPHFNPLMPAPRVPGAPGGAGEGLAARPVDALNTEMRTAIQLLLICWGSRPRTDSVLTKMLDELRRFPHGTPFDWKVKSINTVIGRGNQSLTAMLAGLRAANPTLRAYEFPLMEAALKRQKVPVTWL